MARNLKISGNVSSAIPASRLGTAETKRNHQRPASLDLKRNQPNNSNAQMPTATNNRHESESTISNLRIKLPSLPDDLPNGREQRIGGLTKRSWKLILILLGLTLLWRYVILEKVFLKNPSPDVIKAKQYLEFWHTVSSPNQKISKKQKPKYFPGDELGQPVARPHSKERLAKVAGESRYKKRPDSFPGE